MPLYLHQQTQIVTHIKQTNNMKTLTTVTDVFSFNELSDEAKAVAKNNVQSDEYYLDYPWHESIIDDAKTVGALMGIDVDNIYYNGFSSQGDGAMFTGRYTYAKGSVKSIGEYAPQDKELLRIATELQAEQKKYFYGLHATVEHYGHYYHENSNRINVECDTSEVSGETEDNITELLRDFMRWIYSQLETNYDYLMSDEAVIEYITGNEYEFEITGERY